MKLQEFGSTDKVSLDALYNNAKVGLTAISFIFLFIFILMLIGNIAEYRKVRKKIELLHSDA